MTIDIEKLAYQAGLRQDTYEANEIVYECDFKMKDHTVTLPCTTRGVYYD